MQFILDVFREAPVRSIPESEWRVAIALAAEQQVLPYFISQLHQRGYLVPPDLVADVSDISRELEQSAFLWSCELRVLFRNFSMANIPVIPLKGPSLADRIYGSAALRSCKDLDLLIRKQDLEAAFKILIQASFISMGLDDDFHYIFQRGTIRLELHFQLANPTDFCCDMDRMWNRTVPASFSSEPILTLSPTDELFFLCLHGVRHRFERLSHVLDIALAWKRLESYVPLFLESDAQLFTSLLELGRAMSSSLYPNHCFSRIGYGCVENSTQIEHLAAELWGELLTSLVPPRDWSVQHRFYLRLETTVAGKLRQRLRHLKALCSRILEVDYEFAEQFGLRRRWQVWLLRPFRVKSKFLSRRYRKRTELR